MEENKTKANSDNEKLPQLPEQRINKNIIHSTEEPIETERVQLKPQEAQEGEKNPKKIKNLTIYLLNLSCGLTSNFYNGYNIVVLGATYPTIKIVISKININKGYEME